MPLDDPELVPVAAYRPGDATLDHGDDEHIKIAEHLRGVAVLTNG